VKNVIYIQYIAKLNKVNNKAIPIYTVVKSAGPEVSHKKLEAGGVLFCLHVSVKNKVNKVILVMFEE